MPWNNDNVELYHGTDTSQLGTIGIDPNPHGLLVTKCRRGTDFGMGFYLTTYMHQAEQWANEAYYRNLSPTGANQQAIVLSFEVERDLLASLQALVFVRETPDFWSLVRHCRGGYSPHNRVQTTYNPPPRAEYDLVYGPVAHWRQTLVFKDCDQISVNAQLALDKLPSPSIKSSGNPIF